MSLVSIREAQCSDAPQIANIYNYYIRETLYTFDTVEVINTYLERKILQIQKSYPYLVAIEGDKVIGFAYASQWKEKTGYKHTAETTIYLDPSYYEKGIGARLYNALLSSLPLFEIVNAIACITLPNEKSIRLHEKLGFKRVGMFNKVGFKKDQWIDVEYWQKHI